MATYGNNSLAVRTRWETVDEPQPKSTEMPPGGPQLSRYMPGGGREVVPPQPGRRRLPRGVKDLPWRSWLQNKRPGVKRKKKRSAIGALMG
jgi:hypothetical protein